MSGQTRVPRWLLAGVVLMMASGCATLRPASHAASACTGPTPVGTAYGTLPPTPGAVLSRMPIDPVLEERILALDSQHVTGEDVRTTLACGPTPRIMNLHGGLYLVHLIMREFAGFLIDMGYPVERIREPDSNEYSHSPYESSEKLAGEVAWYYEQEATRLMLIGHSQGGVQAVKVLYELDGKFDQTVQVFDPLTGKAEQRTWIIDPLTGAQRPVVGVSVAYTSAVGSGGAAFLLPNQWKMRKRMRKIPNTTDEFTGYFLAYDLVAWSTPGSARRKGFKHNGAAVVRNVSLPGHYNHITLPATRRFAQDKALRDWINSYVPDATMPPPPGAPAGSDNGLLWATDVWYSVKKHWVLEAQKVIRARRGLLQLEPAREQQEWSQ